MSDYNEKAEKVSKDIAYFISKKQFEQARLLLDAFEKSQDLRFVALAKG